MCGAGLSADSANKTAKCLACENLTDPKLSRCIHCCHLFTAQDLELRRKEHKESSIQGALYGFVEGRIVNTFLFASG